MILQTDRLLVRKFTLDDAEFTLRLLNDPGFVAFIADKGVRTVEAAKEYLRTVPLTMYEKHGFGLWLVELRDSGTPIGMCGLIRRDAFEDVDVGYAFLAEHGGKGYAVEAAEAVCRYGRRELGLKRILAIVTPGNARSTNLLRKLGFVFDGIATLGKDDTVEIYASAG